LFLVFLEDVGELVAEISEASSGISNLHGRSAASVFFFFFPVPSLFFWLVISRSLIREITLEVGV